MSRLAVFLGGIRRVLSWLVIGTPPAAYIGFLMLEIVSAPAFIYWQWQLAQSSPRP